MSEKDLVVSAICLLLLLSHIQATDIILKDLPDHVTIEIINSLPDNTDPLKVRCQSKDDDLGYHTLLKDQGFLFKFSPNFIGTTLYFCHFYWGNLDKSFDVYDSHRQCYCEDCETDICYYRALADGFYFSLINYSDPSRWQRLYTWE